MQSATCSTVSQRIQRSSAGSARWSRIRSAPSSNRNGSTIPVCGAALTPSKLLRPRPPPRPSARPASSNSSRRAASTSPASGRSSRSESSTAAARSYSSQAGMPEGSTSAHPQRADGHHQLGRDRDGSPRRAPARPSARASGANEACDSTPPPTAVVWAATGAASTRTPAAAAWAVYSSIIAAGARARRPRRASAAGPSGPARASR